VRAGHAIRSEDTLYARVAQARIQPQGTPEATGIYEGQVVPALNTHPGFEGAILLTQPNSDRGISISFWETEQNRIGGGIGGLYQDQLAHFARMCTETPIRKASTTPLLVFSQADCVALMVARMMVGPKVALTRHRGDMLTILGMSRQPCIGAERVVVFLCRCWRNHPDRNHTTYHNSHHPSSHAVLPSRTRFDETPCYDYGAKRPHCQHTDALRPRAAHHLPSRGHQSGQ